MYTFEEKNRIIIRIASADHFEKDKELYLKHCSKPKLEREIQRANTFTYAKIDGQILNELLNKLTLDEILANRGNEIKNQSKKTTTTPPKAKKKNNNSKGGKRTREVTSPKENIDIIPESDKKKEPSEKSSPE